MDKPLPDKPGLAPCLSHSETTYGSGLLVPEVARIELVGLGLIPQATIQ